MKNCFECENAIYIGEGGYLCDVHQEVVIDDFAPTEDFNKCNGKKFVKR